MIDGIKYVRYDTRTVAWIGLGEDSRFECRKGRKRILVDLLRVMPSGVALTGAYLRFGRPSGRRPSRDGEIYLHARDYSVIPPAIAECVEATRLALPPWRHETQNPSR